MKLLFFSLISLALLTDLNASRVKKDLLILKENEIIELLEKKSALVDKLITEAQLYNQETDPLIQRNFYNTASIFVTGGRNRNISTHTKNKGKKEKKEEIQKKRKTIKELSNFSFTTSKKIHFNDSKFKRKIFNIPMQRKNVIDTAFSNNINFNQILEHTLRTKSERAYKKKVIALLNLSYEKSLEQPIITLFRKYLKAIGLLSLEEVAKELETLKISSKIYSWNIESRLFLFQLSLKNDNTFKKRTYESSLLLDETFKKLQARKDISFTTPSNYYDQKIDKNLRCIETAKEIKYKGKICITPLIDVDQDKYFEYGTFETKENNFVLKNKNIFESLARLDKELKKSTEEYIKFLTIRVKEMEIEEERTKPLNLEGGL